jgi:hypothetical protein
LVVLLRLAYLGVANVFAMLRLLPMSDREKDAEILALRHQIAVLERQLTGQRVRFNTSDRALLAALLHCLPRAMLRRMRLLVRPDTVLRWHRDLIAHPRLPETSSVEVTAVSGVLRHDDQSCCFVSLTLPSPTRLPRFVCCR